MKRFFIFLATMLILASLLTGCLIQPIDYYGSLQSTSSEQENQTAPITTPSAIGPFQMEAVGQSGHFKYYRDAVTDVLFVWKIGNGSDALTVIPDPDSGLPITYTRYMEMYAANNPSPSP